MSNLDQVKTFILFESTLKSIDMIKDVERKRQIKQYFNLWYKTGIKLWREYEKEINSNKSMSIVYDEFSGIAYETISKLIDTEQSDELFKELQTLLKKY